MAQSQANAAQEDEMTIYVQANRVSCDGGGGALGHPLIFLNIGSDNKVTCPYCSREFIKTQADAS